MAFGGEEGQRPGHRGDWKLGCEAAMAPIEAIESQETGFSIAPIILRRHHSGVEFSKKMWILNPWATLTLRKDQ